MDETKKQSETQKLLAAFSVLLENEDRAVIHLLVQAAMRAIAERPSYEHDSIALAILTIPNDSEEEADAE